MVDRHQAHKAHLPRCVFGPTLNDLGQTAFTANVLEASNSYNGIWKETAAGLSLVVIEGDQPPGLPSGQTLSRIGRPILNNLDQVAFIGGERSQFEGFWTQDNTQSPVARCDPGYSSSRDI